MDDDAALSSFNHALELKPDDPFALMRRSKIYSNLNQKPAAKADLIRVLKVTGNLQNKTTPGAIDTNAATSLAGILSSEGKYSEAISLLDKLYDRSQDQTALYAKAEIEYRQKSYAAALKTVKLGLRSETDNARGLELEAKCLMQLKDLSGSEKAFTEAIRKIRYQRSQRPRDLWRLYDERADLYDLMGKTDLAKRDRQERFAERDGLYEFAPFQTKDKKPKH